MRSKDQSLLEVRPTVGQALAQVTARPSTALDHACAKSDTRMEERINPRMAINYFVSQQGITVEDIGVASIVVISWGRRVIQSLADTMRHYSRSRHLNRHSGRNSFSVPKRI